MIQHNRVLVLGAGGQMGRAVVRYAPHAFEVIARTSRELDIRDTSRMHETISELRPRAIINCAALTQVDVAEQNPELAIDVNARAPGEIAGMAVSFGARFLHISTDYVFDGRACTPYQPDSPTSPVNAYGRSKAEGERAVLAANPGAAVLRTAWVHSVHGRTFVRLAIDAQREGREIRVVDDQISTPTRAANLANALWRLVENDTVCGLLHFTDAGVAARYDVAMAVHDALKANKCRVDPSLLVPVPAATFDMPVARPLYSVLDRHSSWAAIGTVPPHWTVGIGETVREVLDA